MASTRDVVQHHIDALGAGDLDAVMEDYTDESLLLTTQGPAKGLDTLRAGFQGAIDGLFKPGAHTFTLDEFVVEGEVAVIVWRLESEAVDVPYGTDTFIVRDGKIAVQTAAIQIQPKG
jgi:ketosteroid isomerase-like protein